MPLPETIEEVENIYKKSEKSKKKKSPEELEMEPVTFENEETKD